jgi:hypothetical protein
MCREALSQFASKNHTSTLFGCMQCVECTSRDIELGRIFRFKLETEVAAVLEARSLSTVAASKADGRLRFASIKLQGFVWSFARRLKPRERISF